MAGLFHGLNLGTDTMHMSRQGLDAAAHNIANAQKEGYSRQKIQILQRDPLLSHGILVGNGAYASGVERAHDRFLNKQQIGVQTTLGYNQTRLNCLHELEDIFSPELSTNIGEELNKFFSALESASQWPEELSVRTHVIESAKNLTDSFQRVHRELNRTWEKVDDQIQQEAQDLQNLLAALGEINQKIGQTELNANMIAGDLRDQRDRVLTEISKHVDIHYYEDAQGLVTLRGPQETLLVEGASYCQILLEKESNHGGSYLKIRDSQGGAFQTQILSSSGRLGALLEMRDNLIAELKKENDELAWNLAEKINGIHEQGFGLGDYAHLQGRPFFQMESKERAAETLVLDPTLLATTDSLSLSSLPYTPGDQMLATAMLDLRSSMNPTDQYAEFVTALGLETQRVQNLVSSDEIIESALSSKRESLAGVSLDEEATDLLRWQTLFAASSRVITTMTDMLDTLLSLKT